MLRLAEQARMSTSLWTITLSSYLKPHGYFGLAMHFKLMIVYVGGRWEWGRVPLKSVSHRMFPSSHWLSGQNCF